MQADLTQSTDLSDDARPTAAIIPFTGAAALEAKRPTQDGVIWPVPRAEMMTPARTIERMAEDVAALAREHGEFAAVADHHLVALGWTPAQVRLYGLAAARRLGRVAAGHGVTRLDEKDEEHGDVMGDVMGDASPAAEPASFDAATFNPARNADNANEVA